MVVGEEDPDEGTVSVPKKLTIGYFPARTWKKCKAAPSLDEAIAGSGRAGDLHHELEALQHAMEDPAQAIEHGQHPGPLRRSPGGVPNTWAATR